ncbi:hypothetical protein NHH03_11170 [Stieleria sp. TO1_6]|uniref:hypothetical protein n=1 Tax=Stieleria tagensis TaxID=2956795 RepID=UPI00209A9C21|nr:hypothetical protein [Stieleria tagensis]MCO8122301.1 hypothetical protein [Stieleria tagensis]
MKKLLILTVLFGFSAAVLPGCGSEPTVIEPATQDDSGMTAEQQAKYEADMRSGAGSSSKRPGN